MGYFCRYAEALQRSRFEFVFIALMIKFVVVNKFKRRIVYGLLWAVCAGLIGVFLPHWPLAQSDVDRAPLEVDAIAADPVLAAAPQPEPPTQAGVVEFPSGAIENERVIHFTNRAAFQDYLEALAAAGAAPLGQIDALLVARVGADAIAAVNPERYGGEEHFSFAVMHPPLPEVDAEWFGRLQAFSQSARSIVGGQLQGTGTGVLVGILDSGINAHPQFDNVHTGHVDLVGAGIAGAGAAHGTAVASIVAGSEGVAPEAELLIVRVLDEQGLGNSFHVAQGIVQAVDLGAQVLNFSLGVYQDTQILREAVAYAHARGVVMVAAAGNDGYTQMPYPAAYSQVLAVTAVDGRGQHALFPNQSAEIDFAAPGVGVLAAQGDQGSVSFSGTSAAAPFVTGTLASMLSSGAVQTGPQAVDLIKRYLDDAGAPGLDPAYGEGLVNWDRLRERDTAALHDLALADVYLSPAALPGTTVPVQVTVQNRGTSWLSAATLRVLLGEAETFDFTLETLGPGRITTRTVHTQLPPQTANQSLSIAAQVVPESDVVDVRLGNNLKIVHFKPTQP